MSIFQLKRNVWHFMNQPQQLWGWDCAENGVVINDDDSRPHEKIRKGMFYIRILVINHEVFELEYTMMTSKHGDRTIMRYWGTMQEVITKLSVLNPEAKFVFE